MTDPTYGTVLYYHHGKFCCIQDLCPQASIIEDMLTAGTS